jgi:hypothetical protein
VKSKLVRLSDIAPRLARARDEYVRALELQERARRGRERQEAAADGRKKCPDTGKIRYRTMQSAEHQLAHLILHTPLQAPCRAYKCEFCDSWHLTSKRRRKPYRQGTYA